MSEPTKACFKCNQELPLSAFYKHPMMGDGHLNKCKECNKRDVRLNRQDRLDYYKKYDQWRFQNQPHRRKNNEDYAKSDRGRRVMRECRKRHHEEYRAEKRANCRVYQAVQSGRLVKPDACEECGTIPDEPRLLHGHHEDYSKPLDVEWLCPSCHAGRHWSIDEDFVPKSMRKEA